MPASRIKRLARMAMPSWAIKGLLRGIEKLDPFVHLAYSQDGEDMILRRLFERQALGFYVDVGAHHPYRFSNTCYFYRRGWRGINNKTKPDAIDPFRPERPTEINIFIGV